MSDNIKCLSEMERFEIINLNDGDKYNFLGDNDIIVNAEGNFVYLLLHKQKGSFFNFGKEDYLEVSWDYVKKIGSKTIIIDVEEDSMNKVKMR